MMVMLLQLVGPPMDDNPKVVEICRHILGHSGEVLSTAAQVLKYQFLLNLERKKKKHQIMMFSKKMSRVIYWLVQLN